MMRLLRAGQRSVRRLNCGVMWPDPERAGALKQASSLAAKTLRSRGAAPRKRSLIAGGERRCVVQGVSNIGFGELGRVFVYRGANAGRKYGCAVLSRLAHAPSIKRAGVQFIGGVAPLAQWQAMQLISFGRCRPLCSAEVGE